MVGDEELLPPPPKRQQPQDSIGGTGELLPPPPKKKENITPASTQPVQQRTTPSAQSGVYNYSWSGGDKTPAKLSESKYTNTTYTESAPSEEQRITQSAVEKSKKATQSLKSYEGSLKDIGAIDAAMTFDNSFGGGSFEGTGNVAYDAKTDTYSPANAYTTMADGSVVKNYPDEYLKEFDARFKSAKSEIKNATPEQLPVMLEQKKQAANIAAQQYNTDQAELAKDIASLKQIKSAQLGEFQIDDAFMNGMAQTNAAISIALKAGEKDDISLQDELERIYVQQMSQPELDRSIWNMGAEMLGGQVAPMATTIGTSFLTGGIGGAGVAMATYGTMGYGSNLIQGYIQGRQQGLEPKDAIAPAKDFAKVGAATGAIEGGIGFINPFMKAGGLANKTLVQGVKTALVDAGIDGAVAMGMQYANNQYGKSLGYNIEDMDGVLEQGVGEVGFSLAMNALFGGAAKLKPAVHKLLVNGLAQSDVSTIQGVVNKAIEDGVIDAARGQATLNQVLDTKKAYDKMPTELPQETRDAVLPDMERKIELEKQLEEKDDAFKPAIESEIEAVNRKIQEETGAPLTLKEQKAYEKLKERKSDSEKPLLPSEKAELKHYEAREKAAEKRAEKAIEKELEPTIIEKEASTNETTTSSEGTDVAAEGTTTEGQFGAMDTRTPNAEQVATDTPQMEANAAMGTGEAVSVDAASIFEEHSNKRGNFAKDKVLEKMGGLKDKAITITDNFDSMIADLQARADKGEVAFRIDC